MKTFASLASYNYAWYFAGGLVSNIGSWMARIGQSWLVLTILTDNSATALGIVTGLQFAPVPILSAWGGALADRYSKRKVLLVTQSIFGFTSLLLALLVLTDTCQLWQVYALATVQGVVMALDGPARQAFVGEMVPEELLNNAVGLNSMSFNGARLVGPALSGLAIAWWGVGLVLLINALTFFASLGSLLAMRASELTPAPKRRGKGAIREGIAYVRDRPNIMLLMFIAFMLGTFGMNFQLTNVLIATEVFHQGAETYGMLGSVMAIGTLLASFVVARRIRPRIKRIVLDLAGFTLFAGLVAVAPTLWLYALLMIPVGYFSLAVLVSCNSAVQLMVDPAVRGRVMALYMAIFLGGTPVGAPLVGWIGDVLGARASVGVGALMTGIAVAWAVWHLKRNPEPESVVA